MVATIKIRVVVTVTVTVTVMAATTVMKVVEETVVTIVHQ